jgi:hypothetical protein
VIDEVVVIAKTVFGVIFHCVSYEQLCNEGKPITTFLPEPIVETSLPSQIGGNSSDQLMAEIMAGDQLTTGQIARTHHLDPSTPGRWMLKGVLRNGNRIKLPSLIFGGRRMTTKGALSRFLEQINAGQCENHKPKSTKTNPEAAFDSDQLEILGA